jgi:hypothetical protein
VAAPTVWVPELREGKGIGDTVFVCFGLLHGASGEPGSPFFLVRTLTFCFERNSWEYE